MKTNKPTPKLDKAELVNAARIAAAGSAPDTFWKRVEDRLAASEKAKVKPSALVEK